MTGFVVQGHIWESKSFDYFQGIYAVDDQGLVSPLLLPDIQADVMYLSSSL